MLLIVAIHINYNTELYTMPLCYDSIIYIVYVLLVLVRYKYKQTYTIAVCEVRAFGWIVCEVRVYQCIARLKTKEMRRQIIAAVFSSLLSLAW